jgi:hypothetical protein
MIPQPSSCSVVASFSSHRITCRGQTERNIYMYIDILPFYSQYIFSLLIFVIDNISLFKTNSALYDII